MERGEWTREKGPGCPQNILQPLPEGTTRDREGHEIFYDVMFRVTGHCELKAPGKKTTKLAPLYVAGLLGVSDRWQDRCWDVFRDSVHLLASENNYANHDCKPMSPLKSTMEKCLQPSLRIINT